MQKRVPVIVGGKEYVLVSEDNDEYLQQMAKYVDAKLIAAKRDLHLSALDAAVLTALELADEGQKASERAENARAQIQSCLEDVSKAKNEIAELKRELAKQKKVNA